MIIQTKVVFYVYELVCLQTGKWYIGCSLKKNSHPNQLGVSYFTSSNSVKKLFKNNPLSFNKKIIVESDDKNYIFNFETNLLKLKDAKNDPLSWNCHNNDKLINPAKGSELGSKKGGLIGGKSNAINKTGICGRSKEKMSFDGRKAGLVGGKSNAINKTGFCGKSKEKMISDNSRAGKIGILKVPKEAKLRGLTVTNSRKFKCGECDLITTIGPLARHQKTTHHSKAFERN